MKIQSILAAGFALGAACAQAQSGIAFLSDVKGDVTLDAGKASLMAELKKGAKITCARECQVV